MKDICRIFKNMHYPRCWWLTPDEYPKGSLELQQSRSQPVWCHGWATSEDWLGISSSKACETDNKLDQLQVPILGSVHFQVSWLYVTQASESDNLKCWILFKLVASLQCSCDMFQIVTSNTGRRKPWNREVQTNQVNISYETIKKNPCWLPLCRKDLQLWKKFQDASVHKI